MQFTITSAILALAASAAALPKYPTDPYPTGEYMGQMRVWKSDVCGADFNFGYFKFYTGDAGKCQSLNEYLEPGTAQSVRWEGRQPSADGYFLYAYTDEACNGTPVSVGDQCTNVEEVFPGSTAFLAYKVIAPSS